MAANVGACRSLSIDAHEYVPSWLRNKKLSMDTPECVPRWLRDQSFSMDAPEYVPSSLRNQTLSATGLDSGKSDLGIQIALKHKEAGRRALKLLHRGARGRRGAR